MGQDVELSISCQDCVRHSTPDCGDCLVSFVLGETPEQLVMNERDAQVIELFTSEGLVPTLKYRATPRSR